MSTPMTTARPRPPVGGGGFGRGPFAGGGMPAEKSMNFGPSARRLMRRLAPERPKILAVISLGVISVVLSVIGPKILGRATDLIFTGVISKQLPLGTTKEQAVQAAQASGNDNFAGLLSGMDVTPVTGSTSALWARS